MAPGAQWETKRWRVEGFAAVARHFLSRGFPVLLAGSQREIEVCRRIAELAPGAAIVAGETSLAELAELIARSAFVVTNDSGRFILRWRSRARSWRCSDRRIPFG